MAILAAMTDTITPTRRQRRGKQVNFLLAPDVSAALDRFAESRGERPTETARRIVLDALLNTGHLQTDPEPFRRPTT